MAIIGFIGSGKIGGTVARLAVAAGHEVIMSNSRGPETLEGLVADLGPLASAATAQEAAEQGELVLVSIPLRTYTAVPVEPLTGKPVMDANNYYAQRDGHIPELDDGSMTGNELWSTSPGFNVSGYAVSYKGANGKQYVVISGPSLIAYALP